jgi:hypothetical protein
MIKREVYWSYLLLADIECDEVVIDSVADGGGSRKFCIHPSFLASILIVLSFTPFISVNYGNIIVNLCQNRYGMWCYMMASSFSPSVVGVLQCCVYPVLWASSASLVAHWLLILNPCPISLDSRPSLYIGGFIAHLVS